LFEVKVVEFQVYINRLVVARLLEFGKQQGTDKHLKSCLFIRMERKITISSYHMFIKKPTRDLGITPVPTNTYITFGQIKLDLKFALTTTISRLKIRL
jgi:hypothetical protein